MKLRQVGPGLLVAISLCVTLVRSEDVSAPRNGRTTAKVAGGKIESSNRIEIMALIQQLGDEQSGQRAEANARLRRIGTRAIPALECAQGSDNHEIRKNVRDLLATIRPVTPPSVRVDDAEFRVIADPIWEVPQYGDQTRITLGQEIRNLRAEKQAFFFGFSGDDVRFVLSTPDGHELRMHGGRESSSGLPVETKPLEPGDVFVFSYVNPKLLWTGKAKDVSWFKGYPDELAFLLVDAGINACYFYPQLARGQYEVRIEYDNLNDYAPKSNLWWSGRTKTHPIQIQVK